MLYNLAICLYFFLHLFLSRHLAPTLSTQHPRAQAVSRTNKQQNKQTNKQTGILTGQTNKQMQSPRVTWEYFLIYSDFILFFVQTEQVIDSWFPFLDMLYNHQVIWKYFLICFYFFWIYFSADTLATPWSPWSPWSPRTSWGVRVSVTLQHPDIVCCISHPIRMPLTCWAYENFF